METPRQGMLSVVIKSKEDLYRAYMPFVKNGGLFIPTTKPYRLGDDIFMVITLPEGKERLPVAGKVVWITPVGAAGNRMPGIGVQFGTLDKGETRKKIEAMLAGLLQTEHPTHTM